MRVQSCRDYACLVQMQTKVLSGLLPFIPAAPRDTCDAHERLWRA